MPDHARSRRAGRLHSSRSGSAVVSAPSSRTLDEAAEAALKEERMIDINWVYVPPVVVAITGFIAAGIGFWLKHREAKRRQTDKN